MCVFCLTACTLTVPFKCLFAVYHSYLRWYDFVESKKIGSNRPFFAYGILLICSITLIISIGLNGWTFESMTRNPSIGPSAEVLVQMGAKQSDLIVNSYHVWRLIAPMILRKFILSTFLTMYKKKDSNAHNFFHFSMFIDCTQQMVALYTSC